MSPLSQIRNFVSITNKIGTSGMPNRQQLAEIASAGYRVVINLAYDESPAQLPGEAELVDELGMVYIHIPVEWENPKIDDLSQFFAAMIQNQDEQVFVHCVANYRVSAFMYLYRILHLGEHSEQAWHDLTRVWTPEGIWQDFITLALNQPSGTWD
jgi:protein tyrosine phosphatase (PTP) superfamily phosphohydrolase (DUF442 family)